jgi:hypothetical protein
LTERVSCRKTFSTDDEWCCFRLIEYDKHVGNKISQCCQWRGAMKFKDLFGSDADFNLFKDAESREGKRGIRQDCLAASATRVSHCPFRKTDGYDAMPAVPAIVTAEAKGPFWFAVSGYFAFGLNKTLVNLDKESVGVRGMHLSVSTG